MQHGMSNSRKLVWSSDHSEDAISLELSHDYQMVLLLRIARQRSTESLDLSFFERER